MEDRIRSIALGDGRYAPEAFRFLLEGLERAIELAGRDALAGQARHVTGREVLAGLVDLARSSFGPLTPQVWRSWGVRETLDWGHVVFLLVDNGLLSRQESDSIDDFRSDLDLDAEFVRDYRPELPSRL
jgi:uncharacterized repeat protein (TIGR04138 family)